MLEMSVPTSRFGILHFKTFVLKNVLRVRSVLKRIIQSIYSIYSSTTTAPTTCTSATTTSTITTSTSVLIADDTINYKKIFRHRSCRHGRGLTCNFQVESQWHKCFINQKVFFTNKIFFSLLFCSYLFVVHFTLLM